VPKNDYRPGDQVGAFKLVSVNNDEIALEWEGKTITKAVDKTSTTGAPPGS
jgi:hypothetical protein